MDFMLNVNGVSYVLYLVCLSTIKDGSVMMKIEQATQHIDHRCMQNIALQNVPDRVIC